MRIRTLGLDIGSNSVGWALIESNVEGGVGSVLGIGSRIFPEGVNRDQQGAEHSKNEDRRIARGMRRQIARRARRKTVLRRSLVAAGLFPDSVAMQQELVGIDPYVLRSEGLTRRLEPFEFGRVLLHLNQRRGFLSNRKADRGRAKENSATLQEINTLAELMGDRTLGQHFLEIRSKDEHDRIRGQHTRREMYLDEFDRLWTEQAKHHPALLTDQLRYGRYGKDQQYPRDPIPLKNRKSNSVLAEFGLFGILFFQRSLYWPKSVIGRCELTGEKRCPRADRVAQRFRLLNEVNNLRVLPEYGEARPLSDVERAKLISTLSKSKEKTFVELRKSIGLLDSDTFNLERADRKKLLGLPIDVVLAKKDFFQKEWDQFDENVKNAIVRSLLSDEAAEIRRKATKDWGCSQELAERLIEFDPTAIADGYASYSLSAMQRLLPYLERGMRVMGNDASDSALHAAGFLRPDEKAVRQSEKLPDVPAEIANPIVRQAMYEVRKLVHCIIREFGKPDHIHIELAREAKGNAEQRSKYIRDMRENERRRDEAAEWIRDLGGKPTRDTIQRYILWREQGEECIYSGRTISPAQLLGGEVDIDHVLPYSKCLDNSLMNKVVAFRSENTRKGQQTPWQWLAERDSEKYSHVLQRARRLPFGKRQRFSQQEIKLDDFLARQLSDTAYITTCVRQYLSRLGIDIVCTKGQSTAELRHLWGLNGVLSDDGLNLKKNRNDHRHHAIDALVIALTNRSVLQKLARTRGDDILSLPVPWPKFHEQIMELTGGIKISHRVSRGIAGALHEETIYGPTVKRQPVHDQPRPHAKDWVEEEGTFVIRKPVTALTPAMVDEIRDPHVRELIIARLREYGIDHTAKGAKINKEVWTKPLRIVPKSGKVSERSHEIKYVRVLRRDQTIQPIRGGKACVKPGNTHHIMLFDLPGSTPQKPNRDLIAVSMLGAIQRLQRGEPLIQRHHPTNPDATFLFSLSRGEIILAKFKGQPEDLYVFRTAAATSKQMWFVHHCDARLSADATIFTARPNTLDAVKVTIDPLGRIRNAND